MSDFNTKLISSFGYLLEGELLKEIQEVGVYKTISKNEIIIDVDDAIKAMPLLLTGAIKILREDENGDELVLYYLERGDTCAITLSCCLGQTKVKLEQFQKQK